MGARSFDSRGPDDGHRSFIVDEPPERAAETHAPEETVEPAVSMKARAGAHVGRNSDLHQDWKPLMDALEFADSALQGDAWELMMQWNQAGILPMQGRADGTTQYFKQHWFDYPARWGCDEPSPPQQADETGTPRLVGTGLSTSRP